MKSDNRLYELRTYFANPGMLDRLVSRFENHTFRFFSKHEMKVMGLWLPIDNQGNKLVYILSFADQKAAEKSWENFKSDSEWMAIKEESLRDGELVASLESVFMRPLDFSPDYLMIEEDHLFELQRYKNTPDNQELLRLVVSQHNERSFQMYGTSIIKYWQTLDQEGEESNLLICLLVRRPGEGVKETDETANGSLSEFVKVEHLQAVSFSPLK